MAREAAMPHAMLLMVGVVVVVIGAGHSLAAPPLPFSLTQQEMMMSIIINQMTLLKVVNETSFSSSHRDELNQLRQDMEEEWQAMNEMMLEGMNDMNDMNHTLLTKIKTLSETMKKEIQTLRDTKETRTREIINEVNNKTEILDARVQIKINELIEEVNNKTDILDNDVQTVINELIEGVTNATYIFEDTVQSVINELVEEVNNETDRLDDDVQRVLKEMEQEFKDILLDEINDDVRSVISEMLEANQNSVTPHHRHHHRPDPDDLYVVHNDTYYSLCDGHKVLYGGEGGFEVTSSGNYNNNEECSWAVTLPEGSRPVFRWHYIDIKQCGDKCTCDYVWISDPNHPKTPHYCGDNPPDGSFLTIMNNHFEVRFHSDGSGTGRGFKMEYRSVEMF